MKRKLLTCIAILFLLFSLGCSNISSSSEPVTPSENSNGDPIEIEFMHIWGGSAGEAVDRLVTEYNESQDKVHVKPVFVQGSYEGILEKLQILATSNQLPDLVLSGFTYTNYMIKNMPIVPLQTFIDKENMDLSDFFPKMLELGKGMGEVADGSIYGLPFVVSTPVVYYNKDLFEQAGLDPENPPKTFDEWREVAKLLTNGDQKGIYFNYSITGNWLFQAMTETLGGQMIAVDETQVAFNNVAGKQSLQYWVDLINVDQTMPNVDNQQAVQSFTSGKLGVYVNTTASLRQLQAESDFEIGTAPFPVDGTHPRKVPAGGNAIYMIESNTEQEEAAWDFIKFATSPKGTTIISEGIGYMAVRQSAIEKDELLGKYLKEENPVAYTTYTQVDDMVPWYNYPGEGGTRIYKIVQDNIQAALTLQKSVEEALNGAAKEANQLIR
ncbi:ABC transporter substrate-binding protein [Bacillus sp. Marseille-P3661]|uniref:ABC transporter substrate-binding protein n=1 Tax=Bacillus sp. Marseille-P3661 TaxID=1936234 RepID=UPI000C85C2F1|nr:ABC transporter substrate-binding protein [Bacillus sp. Marseille-P3661]